MPDLQGTAHIGHALGKAHVIQGFVCKPLWAAGEHYEGRVSRWNTACGGEWGGTTWVRLHLACSPIPGASAAAETVQPWSV